MGDDDPTIRVLPGRRMAQGRPLAGLLGAGFLGIVLLAAGSAIWLVWPEASSPPPMPVVPVAAPPALPQPPLLGEAALRDHRAPVPRMLRFAGAPTVFILDFPTLEEQGAALNRVAALIEKAGLPRDRVLSEAEMADAIARAGDTPATYYYGHNYRGTDLERFFRLAARDGMPLSAAEVWVEAQFRLARALVPTGSEIAVLSVAAPGPLFDDAARAAILRHELGHGLFATRPGQAEHIRRIWREGFSEAERAALRAFLAREGYDATNEELVIDEAQAYLLFTPDPRFFTAAHAGLTETQVERLRALLRQGIPALLP